MSRRVTGARRWRSGVPLIGPLFGLVVFVGWMLVLACSLGLVGATIGFAVQRNAVGVLIPMNIGGLVVGWRVVRCGLAVTAEGVTRYGVFTTRFVAAAEVIDVAIEKVEMSLLETWIGPYQERFEGVFIVEGGGALRSPSLTGGIKRRYWNNIAPDLAALEVRVATIASILGVEGRSDVVERTRGGRPVRSRGWAHRRPAGERPS